MESCEHLPQAGTAGIGGQPPPGWATVPESQP